MCVFNNIMKKIIYILIMVSFIFCYADVRYDELNKKAKDGDQDAQYSLARLYFTGYGIQKDYKKSFVLAKELADKKNPKGIHLLAIHFMLGCGTEQNTAMAIKLFEEASKLGNLNSTIGLANMYLNGYKNLPKDYKKAYILYSEIEKIPLQEIERKGGMKEDVGDVYSNLGVMYLEGLYVDRDVVKAIDLLERSFALGSDIAANNLGSIYYSDKYGVNNYKKSREWFEIAAKQKNKQAIYSLATLYIDGKGVEKDLRKGLEYLYEGAALKSERCIEKIEEIATGGDSEGELMLGKMYYYGKGYEKDYKKAFEYFNKAEEHGSAEAKFMKGMMYQLGDYVSSDEDKALEYYEGSLNGGYKKALVGIIDIYYTYREDYKRVEELLEKYKGELEKLKDNTTRYMLGSLYAEGNVKQDLEKARKYLLESAEDGFEYSQLALMYLYAKYMPKQDRNYSKAYYWYLMAKERGDEIEEDDNEFAKNIKKSLTAEEIKRIEKEVSEKIKSNK